MSAEIIIVSGLPRSGTSLLMQMLDRGGIPVVTDHARGADVDNPKGYYEFEAVKRIQRDTSWLPGTRGKAFKMVSQLLYHLPASERYRIIFIERDFDEMLASQEKMLQRLGRPAAPRDEIVGAFRLHLENLHAWLARQANIELLRISYNELLPEPRRHAERMRDFLQVEADTERMAAAVDPSLYRNRHDKA
ncbi:MAG TPA: sulfotransferase [Pirellulales bacterium]|nr:sulfotransferase [Pirellulales bacterium]